MMYLRLIVISVLCWLHFLFSRVTLCHVKSTFIRLTMAIKTINTVSALSFLVPFGSSLQMNRQMIEFGFLLSKSVFLVSLIYARAQTRARTKKRTRSHTHTTHVNTHGSTDARINTGEKVHTSQHKMPLLVI